jgi:hypothetical protein
MPVIYSTSQSPRHEQARAPRVFHLNRHAIAARIFDLKYRAIVQALAAGIFHLNHHSTEQPLAAKIVHLKRRDPASRIFHHNYPVIGHSFTPKRFFSELR